MSRGTDKTASNLIPTNYNSLIGSIRSPVETARHSAARSVNALMTATYWEIGRRIVEYEQGGRERAIYGAMLLLSYRKICQKDLAKAFRVTTLNRCAYSTWVFLRRKIPRHCLGNLQDLAIVHCHKYPRHRLGYST